MSGRIALRFSANFHQPARAHQSVILDRGPVTRIYQMVRGLDRLSHKWLMRCWPEWAAIADHSLSDLSPVDALLVCVPEPQQGRIVEMTSDQH